MWKLIRYQRLQALTVGLLAALIATCAVFAPLDDQAAQQALVDVRLAEASIQISGLTHSSVTSDRTGVVAHAGGVTFRLLADRTGLTDELSKAPRRRSFVPGPRP